MVRMNPLGYLLNCGLFFHAKTFEENIQCQCQRVTNLDSDFLGQKSAFLCHQLEFNKVIEI